VVVDTGTSTHLVVVEM
jgi:hypothetical protein